ncbi:MAG: GNAT family N-acetyltransferase [Nitrospiraceae bacterium]|nr:GNAT family N-acetyltransferase [Nitrospiraceae bacterium]
MTSGYTFLAEKQGFSVSQLQDLLATRCSEERVLGWLDQWECLVAQSGEGLVGVAAYGGNSLDELWIRPESHGAGIGGALFRWVEREMARAGESTLAVRTTGHATGFYEKMGALVVGTRVCPGGPLAGWTLTCLEKPLGICARNEAL